jgi:hypothetical protein
LFHWFILHLGAVLALHRPQYTVRLYTPWLASPSSFKSWHNESIALLAPEFEVARREPSGPEGCFLLAGLDLFHNDRPIPDSGVTLFRNFFLEKVRARGPIAPLNASRLLYITRRGAGEGGSGDRIPTLRRRVVENENAFLPELQRRLAFQLVQLEALSVEEKVRLQAAPYLSLVPTGTCFSFARDSFTPPIPPPLTILFCRCAFFPARAWWWVPRLRLSPFRPL